MALLRLGVVVLLVCGSIVAQQRPHVNIPGVGALQGVIRKSTAFSHDIYSFNGIPFAKPPSGNLRFKAPEPAEPWKGILDARGWGRACPQTGPVGKKIEKLNYWQRFHAYFGDNSTHTNTDDNKARDLEDCLNVNVYTRSLDPNAKLPVMVYYHGGSFTSGSSHIYYPNLLLDHEMVLVVPNYRLGPIGFLSMQNEEIPGNAGMLDQVFALEWVRDHIHAFGGDNKQVTVFGESAGGASVSLLALSPLTKGLFNRVIAQSGAALADWAVDREPLYNTKGVAEILGCDMTNDDTITQCLMYQFKDPGYLNDAQDRWSDQQRKLGKNGFGAGTPVVQTTGRIFLDRFPEDIWADPTFEAVPALYGANKHEGTYVLGLVYDDYIKANDLLENEEFMKYDIIKPFLEMFGISDVSHAMADAIETEYVGRERMGNFTAMSPGLIDFGGATFLKAPGYQSLIQHSKFGDSYWYIFNFNGIITIPLCQGVVGNDYPFPPGVCHAAEVPYIFGVPGIYNVMRNPERLLARQMSKMWFNFAKYGNPTPEESPVEKVPVWPPYDNENLQYMRINREMTIASDFTREYSIAKDENFGL